MLPLVVKYSCIVFLAILVVIAVVALGIVWLPTACEKIRDGLNAINNLGLR